VNDRESSAAGQATAQAAAGGEDGASGLCLWAVSISLTHPRSGQLVQLSIPEPPLFEAVRAREFAAWRAL
jgi:hypothetical protein